jgi:hypothetical protein
MTVKYYNLNSENELIEQQMGSIPSVHWSDENNHEYRCYVRTLNFDLARRSILLIGVLEIKPFNTTEWLKKEDRIFSVSNSGFRNMVTGAFEKEPTLNENGQPELPIVDEFTFFLIHVGYNQYNIPSSIYAYVIDAIKRKYNLT